MSVDWVVPEIVVSVRARWATVITTASSGWNRYSSVTGGAGRSIPGAARGPAQTQASRPMPIRSRRVGEGIRVLHREW